MRIINNSVHLAGILVATPELRVLTDGTYVANLRLRIYDTLTSNGSSSTEPPTQQYFNLTAWRSMAREMNRHFKKGSHLMVRGALHNRSCIVDGRRHYRTEINVHEFLALAGPRNTEVKLAKRSDLCA